MELTVWLFIVPVVLAAYPNKDLDEMEENDDFIPFTGEKRDLFDWKLCTELDGREPGNVIASPLSVKFLLAMLYEGTSGQTAKTIKRILQFPSTKFVSRIHNSAVLKSLQAPNPHHKLRMEFRMFIDKKFQPANWYRKVLSNYYGAYIERLDFMDTKTAAAAINEWANVATDGQIKELITHEEALIGTKLMLANSVYFLGKWKSPFREENSYVDQFNGAQGQKRVRYMTQTGLYFYADSPELDSTILRIPYNGKKFAMYILLPKRPNGLNHALARITPFVLRRLIGQLEETSVQVTIPAFKFDYKINFNDMLQSMGLGSIFESSEDMHGISRHQNISVSNILQKASIEVTETGTISSAVSGMEFVNKLGLSDIEFTASHPFLFYIEDEITGTVIFIGKFVDPDVTSSEFVSNPQTISEPVLKSKDTIAEIPVLNASSADYSTLSGSNYDLNPNLQATLNTGKQWKMSKSP